MAQKFAALNTPRTLRDIALPIAVWKEKTENLALIYCVTYCILQSEVFIHHEYEYHDKIRLKIIFIELYL